MILSVGSGNFVNADRLIAVVSSDSAPARRMIQDARDRAALIDASSGKKTRSVLVMDSDHVICSALTVEELDLKIRASAVSLEKEVDSDE